MKNRINFKTIINLLAVLFLTITIVSCRNDDEVEQDDLPQEELTNVILNVKDDETGVAVNYDYIIGASSAPVVKLTDGKNYTVTTTFKNGSEDVTQEIIDAKDEHFLIYNFPKSLVTLTRLDGPESTRTDGKKVGLITKWDVQTTVNASSPIVTLTLIHEPESVSEAQNGTSWGSVTGGETDAEVTFGLTN